MSNAVPENIVSQLVSIGFVKSQDPMVWTRQGKWEAEAHLSYTSVSGLFGIIKGMHIGISPVEIHFTVPNSCELSSVVEEISSRLDALTSLASRVWSQK